MRKYRINEASYTPIRLKEKLYEHFQWLLNDWFENKELDEMVSYDEAWKYFLEYARQHNKLDANGQYIYYDMSWPIDTIQNIFNCAWSGNEGFIEESCKKRKVKLTESQLHNVIKESVKRIIREMEDDEMEDPNITYTSSTYLEDYKALEIAQAEGVREEDVEDGLTFEDEGARLYFTGLAEFDWEPNETMSHYTRLVDIPECGGTLCRDITGGYFIVKK